MEISTREEAEEALARKAEEAIAQMREQLKLESDKVAREAKEEAEVEELQLKLDAEGQNRQKVSACVSEDLRSVLIELKMQEYACVLSEEGIEVGA